MGPAAREGKGSQTKKLDVRKDDRLDVRKDDRLDVRKDDRLDVRKEDPSVPKGRKEGGNLDPMLRKRSEDDLFATANLDCKKRNREEMKRGGRTERLDDVHPGSSRFIDGFSILETAGGESTEPTQMTFRGAYVGPTSSSDVRTRRPDVGTSRWPHVQVTVEPTLGQRSSGNSEANNQADSQAVSEAPDDDPDRESPIPPLTRASSASRICGTTSLTGYTVPAGTRLIMSFTSNAFINAQGFTCTVTCAATEYNRLHEELEERTEQTGRAPEGDWMTCPLLRRQGHLEEGGGVSSGDRDVWGQ
ncbi:unnamed protein product [Darwinula stevensoni]|uniref:Uncharacterized protein n=1 Tax=Darwinula stevensoni TaxID=69355 RepID=A0A7R8XC39_9CRUS|nr:unnamed protein product [Darwinula stevensoni]CAG0887305.1 unnamed protein product [Darwinula stevensoni]